MPTSSANLVHEYLAEMRRLKATGATTAETSFYPAIARLFNEDGKSLKPNVVFSTQVSSSASLKQPDGGFFPVLKVSKAQGLILGTRPERGVVEIKPIGTSLPALAQTPQVLTYLRDFGLVLLTNYHQFLLARLTASGAVETFEPYDLTTTAEAFWSDPIATLAAKHRDTLPDYLARVLIYKVPIEKPKDLAWLLASYAREARARAADHPLAAFEGVRSALQESLGITFEGERGRHFFESTLIQTLFYGMFSAWVLFKRSPEGRTPAAAFNWRLSSDYLRIPVLRTLFHAISERGALNTVQIVEILDLAADALNRVQPGFFATFREEDAVNYFYEPFLEAFDPELRKQLGVWYTPREIVRYMVERVDHLLRTELHEPLGLASPNVQVLDPCCGTGTYLIEVLHRIERTLREQAGDDNALIGSDLRTAATTRIFGFEIMPAPFVIAHLQIANLLEKAGSSLTEAQRAQVFLTNALTGWIPARHPQSNFGFPAFTAERDAAEAVKQADTILVILGNPPYNGYAGIAQARTGEAGNEERDLTLAYASSVPDFPEPQGQGLNDLYIRFFRIAERRIAQNRGRRGIVSFISNYSWLDGLSHPVMRRHLSNTFNNLYIDNLHGDRRISEYAPNGQTSETVFAIKGSSVGIKVGTAVATLLKNDKLSGEAAVHYRDFTSARAEARRAELLAATEQATYTVLKPNPALGLPFKPRTVTAQYLHWPRLSELFAVSFPGVKTSRDALLIDIDADRLEQRMRSYLNPDNDHPLKDSDISTKRFDSKAVRAALQTRPLRSHQGEVTNELRKELQSYAFRPWQIPRYVYRPFDLRWIYWEPDQTVR